MYIRFGGISRALVGSVQIQGRGGSQGRGGGEVPHHIPVHISTFLVLVIGEYAQVESTGIEGIEGSQAQSTVGAHNRANWFRV